MISGSQNETHSENKEINKIDKTHTTPKINVDQKLSEKSKRLKMVLLLSSIFLMTSKRKPEMEFPASARVINISTLTPYLYLGAPERLTWPNPFGIIKNSISCLNQTGNGCAICPWQTMHQTDQPIEPFSCEVCGLDPQNTCEQCDQRFENL